MDGRVKDAEGKKRTGSKPKKRELKGRDKQGLNQVMHSEEVALSGFHSWLVVSSFHW